MLDADAFARDAVARGSAAFDAVIAKFGRRILGPDGELDRPALASIVFGDERARKDLETIVHPEVRRRIAEGIAANAGGDRVVVLESPLLIETGTDRGCDLVVVIAAPVQTRVARLVARGMREDDARSRIAAQGTLDEQALVADILLDNGGTTAELEAQVDRLWADLQARSTSRG